MNHYTAMQMNMDMMNGMNMMMCRMLCCPKFHMQYNCIDV